MNSKWDPGPKVSRLGTVTLGWREAWKGRSEGRDRELNVADSNIRTAAGLRSRKGEVQEVNQEVEPGAGLWGGASSSC